MVGYTVILKWVIHIFRLNKQKQKHSMGNLLQNHPDITLRDHYTQSVSTPEFSIWNHHTQPDSLIQYYNPFPKNTDLSMQLEYYKLRRNSNMLVSTKYLSIHDSHKVMSIFYERVVTDLSKITDIPFKDTIKFYHTAFKGFSILYQQFGYFEVTEDLIFITADRNVKVWCNSNININFPSHSGHGTQEIMIKQILRIIESCTDPAERPQIPLNSLLYNEYSHSFGQVWEAFNLICQRNGLFVSHRLECLDVFDNEEVLKMIDKYAMYGKKPELKEQRNDRKQNKGLSLFQNYKELNVQIQHQRPLLSENSPYKQLFIQNNNHINSRQKQNMKPVSTYGQQLTPHQPIIMVNKTFNRSVSQSSLTKPSTVYFNSRIHNFTSPPKNNQQPPKPYSGIITRSKTNPNLISMNRVVQNRPVFRQINSWNKNTPQSQTNHYPPRMSRPPITVNSKNQNGLHNAQNVFHRQRPTQPIVQMSSFQTSNFKARPQSYSLEKHSQQYERVGKQSAEEERRQTLVDKLSQFSLHCESAQGRKGEQKITRKYVSPPKIDQCPSNISNQSSLFTKPQFWENVLNIRDPLQKIRRKQLDAEMKYLQVPKSIVTSENKNKQTAIIDKQQRKDEVREQPIEFPSFTDISDNISFIPTFEKIQAKNKVIRSWREESAVISHDPNEPILKMPKQKKYSPQIDDEIMRDLKILREKRTVAV